MESFITFVIIFTPKNAEYEIKALWFLMVVYSKLFHTICLFKMIVSPLTVSSLMEALQVYRSRAVLRMQKGLCLVLGLVQSQVEFQCMKSFKILPWGFISQYQFPSILFKKLKILHKYWNPQNQSFQTILISADPFYLETLHLCLIKSHSFSSAYLKKKFYLK